MNLIYIACDSFLSLRNVRNSNLGYELKKNGYLVKVLVDPFMYQGSVSSNVNDVEIDLLIDFKPGNYKKLGSWISWMNNTRRSFKDHKTYRSKLLYRYYNRKLGRIRVWFLLKIYWVLGLLKTYYIFRYLLINELRKTKEYKDYTSRLKKDKPKLVGGFSPEGYREMVLMQAASDLDIPTLIMIRSRDNLVSKIAFLPKVSKYLFWSEHHRKYFFHLYEEFKNEMTDVVGSPQFSRHLDKNYIFLKSKFFNILNLNINKRLVVFFLENPEVYPHQKDLAKFLARTFSHGELKNKAQLLIRNHPRVFGSNYDPLDGTDYENVMVYPKPSGIPNGKHNEKLVNLILDEEKIHLSTMAHLDLNINIFSTTIIDCAIYDKPIINVCYDHENLDSSISIKRFFKRTDFDVIRETDSTDIVYSSSELIDRINYNIENKNYKSIERKKLVEMEIGSFGEIANEKLINNFISIVDKIK